MRETIKKTVEEWTDPKRMGEKQTLFVEGVRAISTYQILTQRTEEYFSKKFIEDGWQDPAYNLIHSLYHDLALQGYDYEMIYHHLSKNAKTIVDKGLYGTELTRKEKKARRITPFTLALLLIKLYAKKG